MFKKNHKIILKPFNKKKNSISINKILSKKLIQKMFLTKILISIQIKNYPLFKNLIKLPIIWLKKLKKLKKIIIIIIVKIKKFKLKKKRVL